LTWIAITWGIGLVNSLEHFDVRGNRDQECQLREQIENARATEPAAGGDIDGRGLPIHTDSSLCFWRGKTCRHDTCGAGCGGAAG
jgi:hypothetical protein